MPNTSSAKKALKKNEMRRMLNKSRKSMVKTSINTFLKGLQSKMEISQLDVLFRSAQEQIQRAVTKGTLHKNTASRRVSRLAKKMNLVKNEINNKSI
jgi:small subunit ribosomal protein S20